MHAYKAFNTIGVEHMQHPDGMLGHPLSLLYAGGPEGRKLVKAVVTGRARTWVPSNTHATLRWVKYRNVGGFGPILWAPSDLRAWVKVR